MEKEDCRMEKEGVTKGWQSLYKATMYKMMAAFMMVNFAPGQNVNRHRARFVVHGADGLVKEKPATGASHNEHEAGVSDKAKAEQQHVHGGGASGFKTKPGLLVLVCVYLRLGAQNGSGAQDSRQGLIGDRRAATAHSRASWCGVFTCAGVENANAGLHTKKKQS